MDELDKKIKHIWHKAKKKGSDRGHKKCPDHNILVSYIDGVIGDKDREKVEGHLLECNKCLDLVLTHHKLKEAESHEAVPDVPAFLMSRAMDLVSEKEQREGIFDIVLKFARETIEIITNPANLGISYAAAPVPVRGEKDALSTKAITLHKTLDTMSIEVEITRTGSEKVNIRIVVNDRESGEKMEGIRVNLLNPRREIASSITKKGAVDFRGIEFGKYIIKYMSHGKEAGQISLNIKE